jgi:uncharacterized protein (DUF952 family)
MFGFLHISAHITVVVSASKLTRASARMLLVSIT